MGNNNFMPRHPNYPKRIYVYLGHSLPNGPVQSVSLSLNSHRNQYFYKLFNEIHQIDFKMAAEANISYSKVKRDNLNNRMVERYYGLSDVIRSHSPIDSYGVLSENTHSAGLIFTLIRASGELTLT